MQARYLRIIAEKDAEVDEAAVALAQTREELADAEAAAERLRGELRRALEEGGGGGDGAGAWAEARAREAEAEAARAKVSGALEGRRRRRWGGKCALRGRTRTIR